MSKKVIEAEAVEVVRLYQRIRQNRKQIRLLVQEMVRDATKVKYLWSEISAHNRRKLAWWQKTYAPSINLRTLKKIVSAVNRPHDLTRVESWQLRLLEVVDAVHPTARKKQTETQLKSFTYYFGKAQESLSKQIQRAGGEQSLSEESRNRILEQLKPFRKILDQLT